MNLNNVVSQSRNTCTSS